jgi:DNA polymerase III alpha subunit
MIKFSCGCEFEQNENGLPIFNPNIDSLPLNCQKTWDMICEGNTKGVFQLESQLGQSKAREVKPRNIEELSDLNAIIRPGCGDAMVKGKSLTNHYIDRKSGKDAVAYEFEVLEPILKSTYGILVYQEQAMQIAQLVAGFLSRVKPIIFVRLLVKRMLNLWLRLKRSSSRVLKN